MDVLDLLSSEEACSEFFRIVRWRGGVYCPRYGSIRVKGHGNYERGLKRYMCKTCGRTSNDKTGTILHYSRLSLREWFVLMLLFLGLHNSGLSLSWLIGRSYMPVECDEVYVTAGLKGRNNSGRIERLAESLDLGA